MECSSEKIVSEVSERVSDAYPTIGCASFLVVPLPMKSAKSGCTSAKSKLSAFGLHRLCNVNEQLEVAARGDVKQQEKDDKSKENGSES